MAVFDEAPECFILSLNTQADMGTGSSQYNFAQQELSAANQDPTIDWKIVYILFLHKPIYISTTNHGPESLPCRRTSTCCLTNMEWIWYYMATTTTTTT